MIPELRQFIQHGCHKPVRNIAAAQAFVETAVVCVHVAARRSKFVCRFNIVYKLRKRVMREESEPVTQTLFGPDEPAVVSGVPDRRIDPGHVIELWKWTNQLCVTRSHELRWDLVQAQIVCSEMVADVGKVPAFD